MNLQYFMHYLSVRPFKIRLYIAVLLSVALFIALQPVANAMTVEERRRLSERGINFINDACPATSSGTGSVDPNKEYQDKNARVIIGVAKTYNLGQEGALIGLMTGLAETNLRNLANNSNEQIKTISESFPHDGSGGDHDSVGLMQQRPSTGWSTFGNGVTREIIGQLMNTAYASQAFFGTPPGAQLPAGLAQPSALQKGLQNKGDWKTIPPWEAAQRVQISAFDGNPRAANNFSSVVGGNYKDKQEDAQSILTRLWDSTPPMALPISVTGGAAPATQDAGCGVAGQLGNLQDAIVTFAWEEYRNPRCGRECAVYATTPKQEYATAIAAAKKAGGYVGYNGIDCGAFVTRAMINSGADPGYNPKKGNTSGQIVYLRDEAARPDGKYVRVAKGDGTVGLQFGDIAIKSTGNSGHTFIFTGHFDYVDAAGAPQKWSENVASASGSGNVLSGGDRAPMAGHDASEANEYEWYRLKSVPQAPAGGV